MPAKRKTFKCGHVGFGRYCHRCCEAHLLKQLAEMAEGKDEQAALLAEAKRLAPKPTVVLPETT
jgi:hypothetical protein